MKPGKQKGDGNILKDGYLLKQSDVLRQWHLRYFVLSKECLCYYRTEQESMTQEPPKELIFFNDMSLYVDELSDKQTKYCLRIVKRSSVAQKTTRTFHLCCFSEQERNEWLAQILHAKAIALVVDPASWMDSNDTATLNPEGDRPAYLNPLGSSAGSDVVASAKQVLRRYRRKLSLGSSPVSSTSFAMVDDLRLERRRRSSKSKMISYWRNTLADMSIQSIMV